MNFVNPSFVFLAMNLVTSQVRADFYVARGAGTYYFAVPANSWNCDGMVELNGKFTGVNKVYAGSAGNMIHFSVEPGLCGYEYVIDGYAGSDSQFDYAIYSEGDGWTQIGTCWPNTNELSCGHTGAIGMAYCKEDWIC